jgi:hypothetical protein
MLGHNNYKKATACRRVIQTAKPFSIMWLQQGCY